MESDVKVLQQQINDHIKYDEERFNDIALEHKDMWAFIDRKADTKTLWALNGLMVLLFCVLTAYLANQIDRLNTVSSQTQQSVSKIEGKMEGREVIFKD